MKLVDGMAQADARAWLLAVRDLCYADLFTFTLDDGSVWRFTSADKPLTWAGQAYSPEGVVIKRGSFSTTLAVQVQTLALTVTPDRDDPALAAFVDALDFTTLRGARVTWRGWYGDSWDAATFTLLEFSGRVSDVSDDEATTINCYSDLALLNTTMPRNIYSSTCIWEVFDDGCRLVRAAFTEACTVFAGGSRLAVVLAASSQPADWYSRGGLQVNTGPLAGQRVSVKQHVIGSSGRPVLLLTTPIDAPLDAGVSISVWPGCDRAKTTCETKFANVARFRGTPYVPVAETAT